MMRNRFRFGGTCLLAFLIGTALIPGRSRADDLVDTLQKKGVLTEQEAESLKQQQQSENPLTPAEARAVEEEQQKRSVATEAKLVLLKGLEGVSIGGLGYVDFSYGRQLDRYYNAFTLTRGYINIKKEILPWLSVRITPDVKLRVGKVKVTWSDAPEGEKGEASGKDPQYGDIELRLKYYYAQFNIPDFWIFTGTKSEVGMGHQPWLDFEESVIPYRAQGPQFQDRAGLISSADLGVNVQGYLGGEMPDDYKKAVGKAWAGKYGSYSLALMNGSGYAGVEENHNKAVEYRLTVRPLPEILPGLQLTYAGVDGRGNQANNPPNWVNHTGYVSYQHEYFTGSFEYARNVGNQAGTLVDKSGKALDAGGWSLFGFVRLPVWKPFRVFGRYDDFDPNLDKSKDGYQLAIAGVSYDVSGDNMVLLDGEVFLFDKNYGKADSNRTDDWRIQAVYQISF